MRQIIASFLTREVLWLKGLGTLYVLAIPLTHLNLPEAYVWPLAFFFLAAMLFTYPLAAWAEGRFLGLETAISLGLIILGAIGLALAPALLIAAIFGHGVWDLFKHRGHGIPFFGWYVSGCVVVDWLYAAALSFYYLSGVP